MSEESALMKIFEGDKLVGVFIDYGAATQPAPTLFETEVVRIFAQLATEADENKRLKGEVKKYVDANVECCDHIHRLEASELQLIGERDHFENQVRDIDIALGGSGEWSNVYDCGVEALAKIAELEAENKQLTIGLNVSRASHKGTQDVNRESHSELWKRITRLEAELAGHRWVSVEDRLPVHKEIVLVYDSKATWQAEMLLNRMFYCEETQHELYGVTHWKPISLPCPEPEKGGE